MDEENWHVWGRSDNGKAARNWVTLSLSAQFHMHYSHFTKSSLWILVRVHITGNGQQV